MDEERELDGEDGYVPRQRAWVRPVAWVAVAALVLGGAFSSALTLLAGGGGRPQAPDAALVSAVTEERGVGSARIALPLAPSDANALRVTFTCRSAGDFSWGIEQYGNPSASCSAGDAGSTAVTDFLLPDVPTLYVTAEDGAEWSVSAVYVALATAT
ncbi:MAG TPA: hypothetical protein VIL55_08185 [Naasia sp.]|jgi:hypothetical protein